MGICTKERKGVTAEVLMATPCTNSLGGESGGHRHEVCPPLLMCVHVLLRRGGEKPPNVCNNVVSTWCITKTEKAESEARRGKPTGTLESESRNAIV